MRSSWYSIGALSTALLTGLCVAVTPCEIANAQESKLDGLRAASRTDPADPRAALAFGVALDRAGHWKEALAELRRGIAMGGSRPTVIDELYIAVARVYAGQHDLPRAAGACGGLDRNHQPTVASHACMAIADLGWQRATEALIETAAALAKDPGCYDAKVAEGRAYELELKPVQAEAALREATAMRSDGEDAHVALGRVLFKAGKKEDGVAELRRALQLDASDPAALYELGMALAPSSESVDLLGRATRERTSFAEAWLALGTQQLAAGTQALARDAADAAVRSDPNDAKALVLAGKIALAGGRADDALKDGKAALKIVANDAAAMLLVADSNAKKGELDMALEAYQTAWGFDHSDPTPLVHASEACHAASRDTSARAFGAKAVGEFPNWAPGWAALGDALVGQGETKAARDAYRSAIGAPDGPLDRRAVAQKLAALK
jgi:tetratricopeptide (TPR) repeat protein